MASGSPQGHIALWDLARQQLVAQQRHAHRTAVAAATFLHGEPLLVTNGADNAIKVKRPETTSRSVLDTVTFNLCLHQVWIFDQEGGGARLLRCRQGHSAPPTTIRHHGNNGKNILSAGKRTSWFPVGFPVSPEPLLSPAGQDGSLQSFSTVHERFNKNMGHGQSSARSRSWFSWLPWLQSAGSTAKCFSVQDPSARRKRRRRKKGWPTKSCDFLLSQR